MAQPLRHGHAALRRRRGRRLWNPAGATAGPDRPTGPHRFRGQPDPHAATDRAADHAGVTPGPSASAFAEGFAVDCAGDPTGSQVVRVLRRTPGLLASGARVSVRTGPLCAGTWQYTVVAVPGREPLAVVDQGPAQIT